MTNKTKKFVYWTPRILSILFILFLTLFSLDVFTPGASAKDIVVGLLMHNIPSIILLIVLIISWKYEIVGTVAFVLAGLLYIFLVMNPGIPWYMALSWSMTISGPAFLIGILFYLNWRMKKGNNENKEIK